MHYEIQDHPLAQGGKFDFSNDNYFDFFSKLYANADNIFSSIKELVPEASEIRCWPHHFDIATLITLETEQHAEDAKSIGIGMSPGDAELAYPYLYITPWPYPDKAASLPEISGPGNWYRKSWTGRLLDLSELINATNQKENVERFMLEGMMVCKELLLK
jgi:hypothetical protein